MILTTQPDDDEKPVLLAQGSRPVPRFLIRELQGTLNWAILFVLLMLLLVFRLFWLLVQFLILLSDAADGTSTALLASAVAGMAVGFLTVTWATLRLLKYLAAIWRLREDSPMAAAEEALQRQRRLWAALAAAALCAMLGSAALVPVDIAVAKEGVAVRAYWEGRVSESQRKVKQHEEEYRRSMQAPAGPAANGDK